MHLHYNAAFAPFVPYNTVRMVFLVSPEHAGKRLDVVVRQYLPKYSRARIQDWINSGRVRVNGAARKPSHLVGTGERVDVEPAEPAPLRALPESIPLNILYQDADVIAVDKPAGMAVHAGAGLHSGTLVNALLYHFGTLSSLGGEFRPGIVHRLDRYTSGVLLVARHDAAHRALAGQFAARQIEKVYLALVHGHVRSDHGRIERVITRDPMRRVRMTARLSRGRAAVTEYQVLRRFSEFTFLEVRIATGRTHQIRVHLSSIGHPVAGDRLYGAPARVEGREPLSRYFLHAHRICFRQPSTGEQIQVRSPLPPELEQWIAGL